MCWEWMPGRVLNKSGSVWGTASAYLEVRTKGKQCRPPSASSPRKGMQKMASGDDHARQCSAAGVSSQSEVTHGYGVEREKRVCGEDGWAGSVKGEM